MRARQRVRNPKSQSDIVAAAKRVVAKAGAAHLTLDAVAREAGISKGGLLYNFPNKEALLEAMIASVLEQLDARKQQLDDHVPAGPNRTVRTLLALEPEKSLERGMGLAVLAASAESPSLLEPLRNRLVEMRCALSEGSEDPLMAYILWLARDMLVMWEVFGVLPFSDEERAAIRRRLNQIACGESPGDPLSGRAHGCATVRFPTS